MNKKRLSIKEIASQAKMDSEEALIRLFLAGLDNINEITDTLSGSNLKKAKKILNIPTRRDLTKPNYWQNIFAETPEDFKQILVQLNIKMNKNACRLPQGAVSKLKKELRRRGKKENLVSVIAENKCSNEKLFQQATKEVEWQNIGHVREPMQYLSKKQIKEFHYVLVSDFKNTSNPICPAGVKDNNLLESAVFRPHTSMGGETKYCTVELAAAALLHALVHDHPFHNGNKRTALVSMLVFLDENGFLLTCEETPLFKFVIRLASHALFNESFSNQTDAETLEIARWILTNSRTRERGNRPISFRKLKKILADHKATIEQTRKRGNRISLKREVEVRKKLFYIKRKTVTLTCQIHNFHDGDDMPRSIVDKIRDDLQLNDEHGIDARAFYEDAPFTVSDFINKYRKTLHRLAKF